MPNEIEQQTGKIFGELWPTYSNRLFEDSVQLFYKRLDAVGFDRSWFEGKRVLDAGCGGGRNAIAMARYGADVVGVDISEAGLADARKRAEGLSAVSFQEASLLDLPFDANHFDMIWCAGVLMHTVDPPRVLDELARVLQPGGLLYLLVYATEGLRWPLIKLLRPLAKYLGFDLIETAIYQAGLPANKRRTFLDDLFTPLLDFYSWERLSGMLASRGFERLDRWGPQARFDHEASLQAYRTDLEALLQLFEAGGNMDIKSVQQQVFKQGAKLVETVVATIAALEAQVTEGVLSRKRAMDVAIGQGHHRVLAVKA